MWFVKQNIIEIVSRETFCFKRLKKDINCYLNYQLFLKSNPLSHAIYNFAIADGIDYIAI